MGVLVFHGSHYYQTVHKPYTKGMKSIMKSELYKSKWTHYDDKYY